MRTKWLSLALSLVLSACAPGAPERIENPAVELLTIDALPVPSATDVQGGLTRSFINAGDTLSIEVFGVDELTRDVRVNNDGTIAYPLIGEVKAAGLSASELGGVVESRLRGRYVRDPHVSVNISEASGQMLTIDGAVNRPGNYAVVADMTLMRAIAAAQGLTNTASTEDVVIFRNVGGQRLAALYSLGNIRAGNYEDPALYPNDIVVVGNSAERQLFNALLQASPLLTTPLIILFQ